METNPKFPTGFSTMTSSIEFADNYNNWILSKVKSYTGRNILEVGTGQGNFKKYLSVSNKNYYSIDLDKYVIERARERDPSGNYFEADISNSKTLKILGDLKFDLIIIINVLEHIKNDSITIENLINLLNKNGVLFIFVPAFQFLYNDLDHLAGHIKRYRKSSMAEIISKREVSILKLEYFNPIGGIGWYLNKLIKHNDLDDKSTNSQMRIFDKYIIPFSKFLNIFTSNFFGQSLITILRKND